MGQFGWQNREQLAAAICEMRDAAIKTLGSEEMKLLRFARSVPVNIQMKLTKANLRQIAYNANKDRERLKKVSESDTLAACREAAMEGLKHPRS